MTAPKVAARRARALERLRTRAGVTFTRHARSRCAELNFHEVDVLGCVSNPELTYGGGGRHPGGRRIYQRNDCAVVVDEPRRLVVTVLLRCEGRWSHGQHTRHSRPQ